MKRILTLAVALALLAPAGAALGQTASEARKDPAPVRVYDMEPIDVHGKRVGPGGFVVMGRRAVELDRLLELRRSFVPEILKSAERLATE